jgi:hypothetical protein
MARPRTDNRREPDQVENREKLGLIFILGLFVVVAVTALIFLIAGNFAALIFIVIVAATGAFVGWRYDRRGPVEVPAGPSDRRRRVLVVANEGRGGDRIAEALAEGDEDASRRVVKIVVPALAGPVQRLASDTDEETDRAGADVASLIERLRGVAGEVSGEVGDSDPRLALEDGLRTFPADEVIVAHPATEEADSLEERAAERAEDVPVPVRELRV